MQKQINRIEQETRTIEANVLAGKFGLEFPLQGMAVVMENGQPTAVRSTDVIRADSYFVTDSKDQIVTVEPMMGG